MEISRILLGIVALVAPFAIYWFIVRPRLESRFIDLYANVEGFWDRWLTRAVAFRTMIFGTIGLMLPEIITVLAGLSSSDLEGFPDEWQGWIRGAALVATMLGRAMSTAPREEPPKG